MEEYMPKSDKSKKAVNLNHKKSGFCSKDGMFGREFLGDFNGDKKVDVLCHYYDNTQVLYFSGTYVPQVLYYSSSDDILLQSIASSPTKTPTASPTLDPSSVPIVPTDAPSVALILKPSAVPSADPTLSPSALPTAAAPSVKPTLIPSVIPTLKPSVTPTTFPTVNPSVKPTVFPSVNPTLIPSSVPTVKPTAVPSVAPTLSPSPSPAVFPSVNPTLIPSSVPTLKPSVMPTTVPTFSPTASPTASPSVSPTTAPTADFTFRPSGEDGYNKIVINDASSQNTYTGTELADEFLISRHDVTSITGGGGDDYYVIFNYPNATLIINDFDVSAPEKIDLTDFPNLYSIQDLSPRSSGGYTILTLQDSQEIRLKGITLGSVTNENFVFVVDGTNSRVSNDDTNYNNYSLVVTGLAVGLGVVFLGLCYTIYASIYHKCPFNNNYGAATQNEEEPRDHMEQHAKSSIASAPVEAYVVSDNRVITTYCDQISVLGQGQYQNQEIV